MCQTPCLDGLSHDLMSFPPELYELDLLTILQKRKWEGKVNNFFKMLSMNGGVENWMRFICFCFEFNALSSNMLQTVFTTSLYLCGSFSLVLELRRVCTALLSVSFFLTVGGKANLFLMVLHLASVHGRHHESMITLCSSECLKNSSPLFYRKSLPVS